MSQPQHVAVPVQTWSTTIELLTTELPMKKVEALVNSLRQCQPVNIGPQPVPDAGDGKED